MQRLRQRQEIKSREYPYRLNLYANPPEGNIDLNEFEQYAIDRLQLLKCIENCRARNMKEEEMLALIRKAEDTHMPLHSNQATLGFDLESERRKDHISHFLLRLAFCLDESLQRWFVLHESILLRLRFMNENLKDRTSFIEGQNLGYKLEDDFYRVPFEHVCDLVAKRLVELRNGDAFVPKDMSVSILVNQFQQDLAQDLVRLHKVVPRLNEEARLLPLLKEISSSDLEDGAEVKEGNLVADDIDKLASKFPPCMLKLQKKLKQDSHLKHGGRMQYGLFLKSIGLPLEQALVYWRRAFSKKYTDEQFQKNYAYNIRHNYGQEGKRVNYTPYSCHRIITNHPSVGDSHGCPFRHGAIENLAQELNLDAMSANEILRLVKDKHYQIACTRYFEIKNKRTAPVDTIVQPSQFFFNHMDNPSVTHNGEK